MQPEYALFVYGGLAEMHTNTWVNTSTLMWLGTHPRNTKQGPSTTETNDPEQPLEAGLI